MRIKKIKILKHEFLAVMYTKSFERYSEKFLLLHRLIVYPSVAIRPIIIIRNYYFICAEPFT